MDPTDPSDEVLVRRTLDGERDAFATLIRRYRRAVLACALAITGDPEDADDIGQEAMIQAYAHLRALETPAKFGPWLMTITRRRALNFLRSTRRRRQTQLPEELPAASTADALDTIRLSELRAQLLQALDRLSPIQREVVLLSDLNDWSHAQIAAATGISVLLSRRHLSDARRLLRGMLDPPATDDTELTER